MSDKVFDSAKWHSLFDYLEGSDAKLTILLLGTMHTGFMKHKMPRDIAHNEIPDFATEIVQAVCAAIRAHERHRGVAEMGLRLLLLLQRHKHVEGTHDVIALVQSMLIVHGFFSTSVQFLARDMLERWGCLYLSDAKRMAIEEALAEAKELQAQPASDIDLANHVDCLVRVRHHAEWEIMSVKQQYENRSQVAEFAMFVLHNFPPDDKKIRYVGEKACRVLLNMVAGSMQDDDDKLLDTCRSYLLNLGVGPVWTLFSAGSVSEDVDFEWLAQRLNCPSVEQNKRVRAAGDSA